MMHKQFVKKMAANRTLLTATAYNSKTGRIDLELTPIAIQKNISILQVTTMLYNTHDTLKDYFNRAKKNKEHIFLTVKPEAKAQLKDINQVFAKLIEQLQTQKKFNLKHLAAQRKLFSPKAYYPESGTFELALTPEAQKMGVSILQINKMLYNAHRHIKAYFNRATVTDKQIILTLNPKHKNKLKDKEHVLNKLIEQLQFNKKINIKTLAVQGKLLIAKLYNPETGILKLEISPEAKQKNISLKQVYKMIYSTNQFGKTCFIRTQINTSFIMLTVNSETKKQLKNKDQALAKLINHLQTKKHINLKSMAAQGKLFTGKAYSSETGTLSLELTPQAQQMGVSIFQTNKMLYSAHTKLKAFFNRANKILYHITLTVKPEFKDQFKDIDQAMAKLIELLKTKKSFKIKSKAAQGKPFPGKAYSPDTSDFDVEHTPQDQQISVSFCQSHEKLYNAYNNLYSYLNRAQGINEPITLFEKPETKDQFKEKSQALDKLIEKIKTKKQIKLKPMPAQGKLFTGTPKTGTLNVKQTLQAQQMSVSICQTHEMLYTPYNNLSSYLNRAQGINEPITLFGKPETKDQFKEKNQALDKLIEKIKTKKHIKIKPIDSQEKRLPAKKHRPKQSKPELKINQNTQYLINMTTNPKLTFKDPNPTLSTALVDLSSTHSQSTLTNLSSNLTLQEHPEKIERNSQVIVLPSCDTSELTCGNRRLENNNSVLLATTKNKTVMFSNNNLPTGPLGLTKPFTIKDPSLSVSTAKRLKSSF